MHPDTDSVLFLRECADAGSFAELAEIAVGELRKFPASAEIVCGPISTGGRGNTGENIRVFNAAISALLRDGRPIFSQMPYEDRILDLRARWQEIDPARRGQYCMPILNEFYLPLIETGLIVQGWFLPDWRSSIGAQWEWRHLRTHGAHVAELSEDWVESILATA